MKRPFANVYFIKPVGMSGPIKIGYSAKPVDRLIALSIWSPFPLEVIGSVPGTMADEYFFQNCFLDLHTHCEWFRYSPELRAAIDEVLAAGSVSVVRGRLTPKGKLKQKADRSYPPERRRYLSYNHRIRRVCWNLPRTETHYWTSPDDVDRIMAVWCQKPKGYLPTEAELARLDEFLSAPQQHAVAVSREKAA